ncbi:hypothetical protein HAX54_022198 [Datura stramonium]|uniref:Uncharacterized protein n=1 Tax=Datura stramonium TaxID=4076 RepID=A0ABS8S434_DATST|nr:hypothetical protein [Datura stramonium]
MKGKSEGVLGDCGRGNGDGGSPELRGKRRREVRGVRPSADGREKTRERKGGSVGFRRVRRQKKWGERRVKGERRRSVVVVEVGWSRQARVN